MLVYVVEISLTFIWSHCDRNHLKEFFRNSKFLRLKHMKGPCSQERGEVVLVEEGVVHRLGRFARLAREWSEVG